MRPRICRGWAAPRFPSMPGARGVRAGSPRPARPTGGARLSQRPPPPFPPALPSVPRCPRPSVFTPASPPPSRLPPHPAPSSVPRSVPPVAQPIIVRCLHSSSAVRAARPAAPQARRRSPTCTGSIRPGRAGSRSPLPAPRRRRGTRTGSQRRAAGCSSTAGLGSKVRWFGGACALEADRPGRSICTRR